MGWYLTSCDKCHPTNKDRVVIIERGQAKCSSSMWMEDMVPKPSSECSVILEGLKELSLIKLKLVD